MIPERGRKRDAYIRKLKSERLNALGETLIDVLEDLFATHDNATSIDDKVKVDKLIGETVSRIAGADKAAEAEAIVRMKELAEARQGQADLTANLH